MKEFWKACLTTYMAWATFFEYEGDIAKSRYFFEHSEKFYKLLGSHTNPDIIHIYGILKLKSANFRF